MLCPVCKNIELVMTDRQGIEIDYCPSCRGVWLDRGELDKIIERTMRSEPANPSRETHSTLSDNWPQNEQGRHRDEHRRDDYEHGHHGQKRSFWKDLFD